MGTLTWGGFILLSGQGTTRRENGKYAVLQVWFQAVVLLDISNQATYKMNLMEVVDGGRRNVVNNTTGMVGCVYL